MEWEQPSTTDSKSPDGVMTTMKRLRNQDTELFDVTLRSKDGDEIKAHRCILAARSSFFRGMFCGSFAEASSDDLKVNLHFDGVVVKALLDYIYTGTFSLEEEAKTSSRREAQILVALRTAADYVDVSGLTKLVYKHVKKVVSQNPDLLLWLFEFCSEPGGETLNTTSTSTAWQDGIGLESLVLDRIRSDPETIATSDVLPSLDIGTITSLLKETSKTFYESERFDILQKWAAYGCNEDSDNEARLALARPLMKTIRLELIDPTDLFEFVESSKLVNKDMVHDAYKKHALVSGILDDLKFFGDGDVKELSELRDQESREYKQPDYYRPFLYAFPSGIDASTRYIIVDWMIGIHEKQKLQDREILYLAVNLLDLYLAFVDDCECPPLKLVGVTCMMIASNRGSNPLSMGVCLYLCGSAFTRTEVRILKLPFHLHFLFVLTFPIVFNFSFLHRSME